MEHDRDAEETLRGRGAYQPVLFASCDGLVKNRTFTSLMGSILKTLDQAYDHPVDIEYTVNVGEDGSFMLNLLQCRPLQSLSGPNAVRFPVDEVADTVFHIEDASMGNSREVRIDEVVYVDPEAYYRCPYRKKPQVAAMICGENASLAKRRCTGVAARAGADRHLLPRAGGAGELRRYLRLRGSLRGGVFRSRICTRALVRQPYVPGPRRGEHLLRCAVRGRTDDLLQPRCAAHAGFPRRRERGPRFAGHRVHRRPSRGR